jgi:hypothetical protein
MLSPVLQMLIWSYNVCKLKWYKVQCVTLLTLLFKPCLCPSYSAPDYVPRAFQQPARLGMLAASGLAAVGLLNLALTGPGLVSTVGALWRKPESKEKAAEQ